MVIAGTSESPPHLPPEDRLLSRPVVAGFARAWNLTLSVFLLILASVPTFSFKLSDEMPVSKILVLLVTAGILLAGGVLYGFSAVRLSTKANLRLVLVSLSLLSTLIVGELFFRHLGVLHTAISIPHPILSHVHAPYSSYLESDPHGIDHFAVLLRFNGQGVRANHDYLIPKPKGAFRILFLGDSYVEARQVDLDHTAAEVLQRRLAQLIPKTEVINAGMSGYCPILEYLYLRERGLEFDPDVVIQFFFVNDVYEDSVYTARAKRDASGNILAVPSPYPSLPRDKKEGGNNNLGVTSAIQGWILSTATARLLHRISTQPPARPIVPEFAEAGMLDETPFAIFKETYTEADKTLWEQTLSYVERAWKLAGERNIPYVLVAIPLAPQVSADQWPIGRTWWRIPKGVDIPSTKPQEMLRSFAEQKGIHFLDLLPALKRQSSQKLYFDVDGHWTKVGNKIVAEALYEFLIEHGILTPDGS